jgi:hypothetical protein
MLATNIQRLNICKTSYRQQSLGMSLTPIA